MSTLRTLLSPMDYLLIKHPLKRSVDLWAPLLSCVTSLLLVTLWSSLNMFGSAGLVVGANNLLQILTGFYITSLAAIATFNGSVYRIDDPLDGAAAILRGEALTRRQFLCHLFAYLALVSLAAYLIGVVGIAVASNLHGQVASLPRLLMRGLFAATYAAIVGHIIGTTLIGLVFLSSRFSRVPDSAKFHIRPSLPQEQSVRPSEATSQSTHADPL